MRIINNFTFIRWRTILRAAVLFSMPFGTASAQIATYNKGLEQLFTAPLSYVTHYIDEAPDIDGDINERSWEKARWTTEFTDIEGTEKPKPYLDTRVKILWDKNYLYIAAELQEPHVWANVKNHDEVVFYDNDFEVFIDPDNNTHQYFEIEVNALNTIFDLFLPKTYRSNSGALIPWDARGIKSAIRVNGTLNNPQDTDMGWTVEMAVPFSCISIGNDTVVPREGSLWRLNFSRVEWDTKSSGGSYVKVKDEHGKIKPENNWVWSPQGVVNMHYPERWGYLSFTRKDEHDAFILPYSEKQRQYLWLAYYRQKEYYRKYKKYSSSLSELGLPGSAIMIDGKSNKLVSEATSKQFTVTISSPGTPSLSIDDEGLVQNL